MEDKIYQVFQDYREIRKNVIHKIQELFDESLKIRFDYPILYDKYKHLIYVYGIYQNKFECYNNPKLVDIESQVHWFDIDSIFDVTFLVKFLNYNDSTNYQIISEIESLRKNVVLIIHDILYNNDNKFIIKNEDDLTIQIYIEVSTDKIMTEEQLISGNYALLDIDYFNYDKIVNVLNLWKQQQPKQIQ